MAAATARAAVEAEEAGNLAGQSKVICSDVFFRFFVVLFFCFSLK